MLALDRALTQLEKNTGFAKDFDRLVVGRGGFPSGWMTAEQINQELDGRGFWRGSRSVVHADGRVRLLERFLDQRVEEFLPSAKNGWKRFDGQYKRNPRTRLIDYRGQQASRSISRRDHTRVDIEGVTCQYGPVMNISPVGLMFSTVESPKMAAGDRGFLRIKWHNISLRVRVKAIWVSPDDHGTRVGCDFRNLSVDDQQNLSRIMIGAATEDE